LDGWFSRVHDASGVRGSLSQQDRVFDKGLCTNVPTATRLDEYRKLPNTQYQWQWLWCKSAKLSGEAIQVYIKKQDQLKQEPKITAVTSAEK
jgi:hypothetical protein